MNNRIKLPSPKLNSRADMLNAVAAVRAFTLERNRLQLERERKIKELDDYYSPLLDGINKQIEQLAEALKNWADANPAEFGDRRSIETEHGTIGYRIGQPRLKTLSGWTWDRVLEKLRAVAARFVRVKYEVDKVAIITERDALGDDTLRSWGLRIVQDESFFVEPNIDEHENKQIL